MKNKIIIIVLLSLIIINYIINILLYINIQILTKSINDITSKIENETITENNLYTGIYYKQNTVGNNSKIVLNDDGTGEIYNQKAKWEIDNKTIVVYYGNNQKRVLDIINNGLLDNDTIYTKIQ